MVCAERGPVSDHRCVLRHCRQYRDGFAIAAERVGFIGKIVVGTIGFVWVVATALVVPVLAAGDIGPIEAIQRSVELFKKSWGEDLIGTAGIGLAFGVVMAVVAFQPPGIVMLPAKPKPGISTRRFRKAPFGRGIRYRSKANFQPHTNVHV
jgi:hypothetical protein